MRLSTSAGFALATVFYLVTLGLASPVVSQEGDMSGVAPFRACGDIADDGERLSCFDAALRTAGRSEADRLAADEAAHSARVLAAKEAAEKEFGLTLEAKKKADEAQAKSTSESSADEAERELREATREPDTVDARVGYVTLSPHEKYIIVLEDGQVWREVDRSTHRGRIRAGAGVTVFKRMLGGYGMRIEGTTGKLFVRRMK